VRILQKIIYGKGSLVYSTLHWKRLVNGYAGIEPSPYLELRSTLRRFPSEADVCELTR
jgi:hypothetical protein